MTQSNENHLNKNTESDKILVNDYLKSVKVPL